jgi:hypothetical protein
MEGQKKIRALLLTPKLPFSVEDFGNTYSATDYCLSIVIFIDKIC